MPWEYCSSTWVSVALKASRMGYSLHGHDIEVEACVSSEEVIDVEQLARLLEETLSSVDYRPLWDSTGKSDPLIEDLLLLVHRSLEDRGLRVVSVTARLPRGRVIRLKPSR